MDVHAPAASITVKPIGTMHFSDVYTYAAPFSSAADMPMRETFLLRVIKARLEETLQHELDDDTFLGIMDAAYSSNGSGPLPYGPQMGPQMSFGNYFEKIGYPENYARIQGDAACHFFVDSCGIFRGKKASAKCYNSLILHIPHSGTSFPEEERIPEKCARRLVDNASSVIDWYTDELFVQDTCDAGITAVIFPYCRTYCDVERMIDDPMEKKNLGICPLRFNITGPDYGFNRMEGCHHFPIINEADSFRQYQEYHHKMEDLLLRKGGISARTLLIDCHSFSSRPTPILPDYDADNEVDICIGYNEDKTKPSEMVIGTILHHFRMLGYKVGVNAPFSNAKTFNTLAEYHSLMIEVNKKLYMDEDTLEKKESFEMVKSHIGSLYGKLMK